MNSVKLYNYFRSSTSYRVRIALELKNISYSYIPIHLINNGGEQNSANYRLINPVGGVPTLEHNGNFISQSMAIVEYIEDNFNSGDSLFPKNIFLRAKTRQICEIINSDIHPLQNLKVTQFLNNEFGVNETQKQLWLNKWIGDGLAAVEKTLLPYAGSYCLGDTPSAADIFLIPQLFSAQRFNVEIKKYEKLMQINENCLRLVTFQKAHPYKQPDTPTEFLNK